LEKRERQNNPAEAQGSDTEFAITRTCTEKKVGGGWGNVEHKGPGAGVIYLGGKKQELAGQSPFKPRGGGEHPKPKVSGELSDKRSGTGVHNTGDATKKV